jgi:hypothetical protein
MLSNNNIIGMATGALMAFASFAQAANTVTLTQNPYSYSVGGEFSAQTTGNYVGFYNSAATYNGEFETFCVETAVDFNPGTTYNYTLSSTDSQGRALSEGAAYLYTEFALGKLAGYDYTDASTRQTDAGELQAAIWAFQGGQSYGGFPSLSTDPFYQLATNTLGGLASADSANNGLYDVDILQMWNSDGVAAQNQLVFLDPPASVPDAASTGGLLAAAAAGLIILSKRNDGPKVAFIPIRNRTSRNI